jgi:signal transduction histidine kinase
VAVPLARAESRSWLTALGLGAAALGALLAELLALDLVPASPLLRFAPHAGLCVQLLSWAVALARALNRARDEFAAVSGALSSELAAVSEALRSAEEASQRAERATRVRDEFIATMSHEFRTPLNPIINIPQGLRAEFVRVAHARCAACAAMFELEAGDNITQETPCPDCQVAGSLRLESSLTFAGNAERARTLLVKVEHSGEQLLRVVNAILDFSKMEAHQLKLIRERFDARAMVRELIADLDEVAQRAEIDLSLAGDQRATFVYADPQRVREVLGHLIDNAIKFRRGPGAVVVSLREESDRVAFSVADQGIGIAQEHLASVFTSFEQVSKGNTRSYGGTGLGLTMARSLVQMHGGEISATSELLVGSTFRFWIPKASPARGSLRSLERLSLKDSV